MKLLWCCELTTALASRSTYIPKTRGQPNNEAGFFRHKAEVKILCSSVGGRIGWHAGKSWQLLVKRSPRHAWFEICPATGVVQVRVWPAKCPSVRR